MNGHVTIIVYLHKRAVLANSGNLKMTTCYPPQLLLRKRLCFHRCLSVHRGGVHPLASRHPLGRQTVLGQTPPGRQTPPRQTPQQTATAADGTHPTGMHSCSLELNFFHVTSGEITVHSLKLTDC